MSSVLNHPAAEWFYAYFICISLNRYGIQARGAAERGGGGDQSVKEKKSTHYEMTIFKAAPAFCQAANLPNLTLIKKVGFANLRCGLISGTQSAREVISHTANIHTYILYIYIYIYIYPWRRNGYK